jgi:hypothetical protein
VVLEELILEQVEVDLVGMVQDQVVLVVKDM